MPISYLVFPFVTIVTVVTRYKFFQNLIFAHMRSITSPIYHVLREGAHLHIVISYFLFRISDFVFQTSLIFAHMRSITSAKPHMRELVTACHVLRGFTWAPHLHIKNASNIPTYAAGATSAEPHISTSYLVFRISFRYTLQSLHVTVVTMFKSRRPQRKLRSTIRYSSASAE